MGDILAIYPTKSSKLNKKSRKFKVGLTLTCVFSVIFLLLSFNFFKILTKSIVGTFGLLIYPLCIFFIVLGILFMLNKSIKTSKSIATCLIVWLAIFVLILQMATSKTISSGFGNYLSSMYKSNYTAGGVIFGFILYPIYFLTYDVATYIILTIALVIVTAILIDKIYLERSNKKLTNAIKDKSEQITTESENIDETNNVVDNDEIELSTPIKSSSDDDIFISDEEDEQKQEARHILGLVQDENTPVTEIIEKPADIDYTKELEKQFKETPATHEVKDNKPNIYVHEDAFEAINTTPTPEIKKTEPVVDKDAERKKAALDYLNISKGKFETKNQKTGFDNVRNTEKTASQDISFDKINQENKTRLSEISTRLNALQNKNDNNSNVSEDKDIYDDQFTKADFVKNKEQFASQNKNLNNAINNLPEMAKKVYSGEVKENIVDSQGFRPVQVTWSDNTPKPNNSIQQKMYKKPPTYIKPPLDLLKKYSTNIEADIDYVNEKGQLIVDTLKAFKIDTKIINAIKGPTFTRYELQMAPGISVNSVNNKINDLSMALESTCRVQVPIPGKNAFGIEVPNKNRMTVGLREILESSNFQNSKSPLTFALGKNISATCKVASIDKLVHTLVAGSTGSGKSVCLNTMLVSLLYKASPDDLRLILVDPKTVEFSMFNNLPHLLIPNTITECDKAIAALGWLVDEMERRYRRLNQLGVKKISEYNESPEVISGAVPKMYYIVMVFDEVGDFMNRAKKEIEEKILLLAAKSRACGIHLVLATQRPTVDVITGTIKANLPSRIAFAVNSYNDSKTILESSGAEYLLGMGDMLFLPQGSNDMDRIQGCFIDNNELKSIINFVKENNEAIYDEKIEDQMFNKKEGFDPTNGVEDQFDPLLKDCLKYFIKAKKASASSLQAYFGIGYPKANKIVLQMEKAGFVSAGDSNGRRTLFITPQEYEERFGENLDE